MDGIQIYTIMIMVFQGVALGVSSRKFDIPTFIGSIIGVAMTYPVYGRIFGWW